MHQVNSEPTRFVQLEPYISGKVALKRICESCVSLLAHHEVSALNRDPEGVHQMRVSIRRLRAAVASFKESIPKPHYRWVQKELRWLTKILGSARDIDVFQSHLLEKASEKYPEGTVLQEPIIEARKRAYTAVERAIQSPRYQAMKFGLAHWLDNDQPDGALQGPLGTTVPAILDRSYKRALKLAKKYDDQDERHDLRIALKKLRYTSELFGSIYNGDPVNEFAARLKRLQDDLGDENDVRVGRQIVAKLAKNNQRILSVGHCILDWHDNRVGKHEERTVEHLNRFANTATFWN